MPFIAIALLSTACSARGASLPIDRNHTAVVLTWNHRGLSHPVARLEKVEGAIALDAADITRSSVDVSLPLDGLRTGNDHLDKRLRSAEFFDLATYPAITFKSTRVETAGKDALKITGDLSVHGVTQSVVLDAKINRILDGSGDHPEAGFDATVELRRSDFGVGKFVPMVSDEVAVHITVEVRIE